MRRDKEEEHVGQQSMRAFKDLMVALLSLGRQVAKPRDQGDGRIPKKSDGLVEVDISAQPVNGRAKSNT